MDDQGEPDNVTSRIAGSTSVGAGSGEAGAGAEQVRAGADEEVDLSADVPVEHLDVVATLEEEIASVGSALETIDRIIAEGGPGSRAADEIDAVVSGERFVVVEPPVGD